MKLYFSVILIFLTGTVCSQTIDIFKISDVEYRFINKSSGTFINNKVWNEISDINEGFYLGYDSLGLSYVKEDGNVLNDQKYKSGRFFNRNRAAVHNGNKWGFLNKSGSEIIPFEFDFVYDFKDSVTFVVKNKQWSLIDTLGNLKSNLDIDYSWGFDNGIAKVRLKDSIAYMNTNGLLLSPGWTKNNASSFFNRNGSNNRNNTCDFCPSNFDFEDGAFTNWVTSIGSLNNLSPDLGVSTPRHEILTGGTDPYGGFSTAPPPPSINNYCVRLGEVDVPGRGSEQLEYTMTIPSCSNDYTFMYQYALVFQDPGHPVSDQPRFKVQLIDVGSGQELSCASVDYTAGYGGASFFTQSSVGREVYYKSWTPVFINLGRYAGRTLTIRFTTLDCGWGGHWCYAYIDINKCGYSGISGLNSCNTPVTTSLNAPPGFSQYIWSVSSNFSNPIGTGQQIVLTGNQALPNGSNVFVQLIPQNGANCSDTIPITIQPSIVVASFQDQLPQCFNSNSYTFTSNSQSNGNPIIRDVWEYGNSGIDGIDSGNTVTHHFNVIGNSVPVTLTSTTSDGCVDDTTINVAIIPSPQLIIDGNNVCSGSSTLMTLTGADTYTWSPRTGVVFTSSIGDSAIFPSNNSTLYNVRAEDTTTQCYTDTTIQVKFFPNPIANFTPPSPVCFRGNNIQFQNNSTINGGNIVSYEWDLGDNTTSLQASLNHHYDSAGVYTVHLYAVSDSGCKDTATQLVIINAHPSSNILANGPLKFCYKDSVLLNALYQAGSGTITKFEWLQNGVIFLSGAAQSTIKIDATGNYSLVLENSNFCTDTSLIQPVIVHPLPTGSIVTDPPNTDFICKGSDLKLNVVLSTATGYQWYFKDTLPGATYQIIPGANAASYQATDPGNYTLALSTSTTPVCRDTAFGNIQLRLIQKPKPDFSYPYYCTNRIIPFVNNSVTSLSEDVTWAWDFGDLSPISNLYAPSHIYSVGTNYPITLTVTPVKCPNLDSSITKIIPVEDPIPGIRYPDVNSVKNNNTPLQARTFGSSYLWTPSMGLSSSSVDNPIFNYNREIDYSIKIETNAGCITYDSQLVRIFVIADIQVPKAFSPNGDSHNDNLDVFLIGIKHLNFFKVFNRWGQLVFETTDERKRWDGTVKGVKQPAESYVWIGEGEDLKGNKILKRGQFILVR